MKPETYSASSVALYDRIYTSIKDYRNEADRVHKWIQNLRPSAKTILDVACGTAEHARYLKTHYSIDGLDISPDFVAAAQKKNPESKYFLGDMTEFSLNRRYDVVMSLFSSIGYVLTQENLTKTIKCFAQHLTENGIMIIEPWFTPEEWHTGRVHMLTVNEPDLKVARMNISEFRNGHSYFNWHFLVGTPEGVQHFTEEHTLGLFTQNDMVGAFEANGLRVQYDAEGIFGRGLYYAVKMVPEP